MIFVFETRPKNKNAHKPHEYDAEHRREERRRKKWKVTQHVHVCFTRKRNPTNVVETCVTHVNVYRTMFGVSVSRLCTVKCMNRDIPMYGYTIAKRNGMFNPMPRARSDAPHEMVVVFVRTCAMRCTVGISDWSVENYYTHLIVRTNSSLLYSVRTDKFIFFSHLKKTGSMFAKSQL